MNIIHDCTMHQTQQSFSMTLHSVLLFPIMVFHTRCSTQPSSYCVHRSPYAFVGFMCYDIVLPATYTWYIYSYVVLLIVYRSTTYNVSNCLFSGYELRNMFIYTVYVMLSPIYHAVLCISYCISYELPFYHIWHHGGATFLPYLGGGATFLPYLAGGATFLP